MVESTRLRIVVAEDNDAVLELIRTRLELVGYDVSYARNGLEALEMIKAVHPAGVVLDLNMPVLDGFGVLSSLRTFTRRPPVLVLSARYAAEDVKRCLALGAKDYLAKPFNDRDLIARVGRLVRPVRPRVAQASPHPAPMSAPIVEDDSVLL